MIYFDNSATSYPKPLGVYLKAIEAQFLYSFNSGRGGYSQCIRAGEKIYEVREKAARMFNLEASGVVFTKNCTEALNIAIKGSVKQGDHILMSSLEHNSVSRVVNNLGNEYDIFDYDNNDDKTVESLTAKIKENTRVVVCTHASNVFGCVLPIRRIGAICKSRGITFIVDAPQTAGTLGIDMQQDNIDILCTAGHKGLIGTMGTGLLMLKNADIKPLLYGGTGSNSFDLTQPTDKPEGFEAGTLNNGGILSLGAGIDYINNNGISNICNHEMELCKYLYGELESNPDVTLYTPQPENGKSVAIISFNFADYASEKTAAILADNGICTRAGYHCAPLAHKHFGTAERGTVRISLGAFNKPEQCVKLVETLNSI